MKKLVLCTNADCPKYRECKRGSVESDGGALMRSFNFTVEDGVVECKGFVPIEDK